MSEEHDQQAEIEAQPIEEAINKFIHCIRDAEEALESYVPAAIDIHNARIDAAIEKYEQGIKLTEEGNTPAQQASGARLLAEATKVHLRSKNANVPETIEKAMFLNIFSDFDAFSGSLISAIFSRKPQLYESINKQIHLSEILSASSIDEIKLKALSDLIEGFRRNSYIEQFSELESRFSIPLKKFDRWSEFVEVTQRRNIVMHCNGIASSQYISICKEHKVAGIEQVSSGQILRLDSDYIFEALDLFSEVAIKLGHTLWRKVFPDEIELADECLCNTGFSYLETGDFIKAERVFEFALQSRKFSSELSRRIFIINLAIAQTLSDKHEAALETINSEDWSASTNDLKLAEAILRRDFKLAKELMLKIGEKGEIINELSYHQFPLFHEFRETPEFRDAYEVIYGYSYISEVRRGSESIDENLAGVSECQEKINEETTITAE